MARVRTDQLNKKRSLAELDQLARRVAQLFYEDQLTFTQIKKQLVEGEERDVRGERDVRLLLNRARDAQRQLVKVKAEAASATAPPIDEELSQRLADAFHIPVAIVARTGTLGTGSTGKQANWDNDELHRQLGAVAARHFLAVLRDDDLVGVGAGRGTGFTIDALRPLVSKEADVDPAGQLRRGLRNLHIYSLIGSANVVQAWGGSPENLEADNNAGKLASILLVDMANVTPVGLRGVLDDTPAERTVGELRVYFEKHRVTVDEEHKRLDCDAGRMAVADFLQRMENDHLGSGPTERDAVRAKYAPHLADTPRTETGPNLKPPLAADSNIPGGHARLGAGGRLHVALFGFGVLGESHHLLRFEQLVTPVVRPQIQDLMELCKEHNALRTSIIDVCDSFGLLPVPNLPEDCRKRAQDIVDTLNRKMLVVTPTVLDRAREKILVGGGAAKLPALEGILRHPEVVGIHPTTIVTDEASARAVLGL